MMLYVNHINILFKACSLLHMLSKSETDVCITSVFVQRHLIGLLHLLRYRPARGSKGGRRNVMFLNSIVVSIHLKHNHVVLTFEHNCNRRKSISNRCTCVCFED
jgi:hypothetical protein